MGADYSFELISIVHWVPQFIGHNKIFLGSVISLVLKSIDSGKLFPSQKNIILSQNQFWEFHNQHVLKEYKNLNNRVFNFVI